MNGSKLFLDTNIIIYLFGGDQTLAELIDGKTVYVSFVTELELLSYSSLNEAETSALRDFLSNCTIIDINSDLKESVIELQKGID